MAEIAWIQNIIQNTNSSRLFEFIETIKDAFIIRLENIEYIDANTKSIAIKTVKKIKQLVFPLYDDILTRALSSEEVRISLLF